LDDREYDALLINEKLVIGKSEEPNVLNKKIKKEKSTIQADSTQKKFFDDVTLKR
jgi:hypothetical protein